MMLTPEQLKQYREGLDKYFLDRNRSADNRGIIGALLSALGIERSRTIPNAFKRLSHAKADALKNWSGQIPDASRFKPFDIMLRTGVGTGELEPSNFDWSKITGEREVPGAKLGRKLYEMAAGKRDNHAYILLPYKDKAGRKKLVPTVINNFTGKGAPVVAAHPRINAAYAAVQKALKSKKPLSTRLAELPQSYLKRLRMITGLNSRADNLPAKNWNTLVEQNADRFKPSDVVEFLKGDADKRLGNQATYRFLRFKDELNPAEMQEVQRRLAPVLDRSFTGVDNTASGAKNFLLGPGKARSTFKPNQAIPTCSGGVCYAFEGLRDMPSVSRALPQDLAMSDSLKEVGNFFPGKVSPSKEGIRYVFPTQKANYTIPQLIQSQATVSKNNIQAARRALQARIGMAALPLAAGGYMVGGSPTFKSMMNPLAEQSKLIGQKVQGFINKAKGM